MLKNEYPCTLTPDPEGGFTVSFPDVPEALTYGQDKAEALKMAEDGLSEALVFYIERDQPLPAPSPCGAGQYLVPASVQISLKAAIHQALRDAGERPADLARRLNTDHKTVRRILDPDLYTKTDTLEAALSALGQRVSVTTKARTPQTGKNKAA